jgi:hypothetical protein
MGHQTTLDECNVCGGLTILTKTGWNGHGVKSSSCVCNIYQYKIMKIKNSGYVHPIEADAIESILNSNNFDDEQKAFYKAKILYRISELKPLVNECTEKNVSLQKLDSDINNEWNRLILMRNKYCL